MKGEKIMADKKVETMNIYEKLSAISLEITNVAKNLNVGTGSSTYKAVGEADVLAAVRPTEAKFRVYSYPFGRKIIDTGIVESVNYKGEVKKQLFERIEVTYRFINMDNPAEFIDIVSYGDGIDTGDKSVGKAMTYADKYALLKAYKIITGDDPDQDASETLVDKKEKQVTPVSAKKGLSEGILKEIKELDVTVESIAEFLKKKPEELNDNLVTPVLTAIRRKRKNQAAAKAKEQAPIQDIPEAPEAPVIQNTNDADWVG